jgi:GTPase SAR1 family protein
LIVNEVIVIGNAGVGKTNLIYVFDKGKKPLAANPTIGV